LAEEISSGCGQIGIEFPQSPVPTVEATRCTGLPRTFHTREIN
jgi:hypothetical protein